MRRRSWRLGAGLSALCLGVAVLGVVSVVSVDRRPPRTSAEADGPHVVLQAVDGKRLVGWRSGDGLCLDVEPGGAGASGGCGFDDSPTGGHFAAGGAVEPRRLLVYGPVPAGATAVRVVHAGGLVVVPTRPLPAQLARGRFFVTEVADDGALDVQPVDAAGRPVAPADF